MNFQLIRSAVISLGLVAASMFTSFTNIAPAKAQINVPDVPGPFTAPRRNPLVTPNVSNRLTQYSSTNAPVLRIGSRGQAVRDVQTFLRQQGLYTGAIDGIYGQRTAAAVEAFQRRYVALRNDGILGQNTWRVILDTVS